VITVIRAKRPTSSVPGGETFTGSVWKEGILPRADGVSMGSVHFAPGARTHWHTHEGGQILIVVAGEGLVGDADGVVRIAAGDVAWTPGGVRHWHGATQERHMLHTAISLAGVTWHEALADEGYLAAVASGDV
jgi:quercetin dioxygenase-like cupin family protein